MRAAVNLSVWVVRAARRVERASRVGRGDVDLDVVFEAGLEPER